MCDSFDFEVVIELSECFCVIVLCIWKGYLW